MTEQTAQQHIYLWHANSIVFFVAHEVVERESKNMIEIYVNIPMCRTDGG